MNTEKAMGWSEWIYAKVSTALNIDQMYSDNDTCENKKISAIRNRYD
jgi:hypothetical protein